VVKNDDPKQFLSNCKLYLDIADRDGSGPRNYLLVDAFTLNASEERFVPIVSFNERPSTAHSYVSLDEVRKNVKVLSQFMREHPEQQQELQREFEKAGASHRTSLESESFFARVREFFEDLRE
jgi:hypothetical protein